MLDRMRVDDEFRRKVWWAVGLVALVAIFAVLYVRGSGEMPSDDASNGGAAPPLPAPTSVPSPSPSQSETQEAPRPTRQDYEAAEAAAIGFLTAANTWQFPIDLAVWQSEVSRYTSATSPYIDLLVPTMSLQMLKYCERNGCEQSATVTPVGTMQYLGDGGFRGRYTVSIEANYIDGGQKKPSTWEVEVYGTPPAVNFAVNVGTSGGADGR